MDIKKVEILEDKSSDIEVEDIVDLDSIKENSLIIFKVSNKLMESQGGVDQIKRLLDDFKKKTNFGDSVICWVTTEETDLRCLSKKELFEEGWVNINNISKDYTEEEFMFIRDKITG